MITQIRINNFRNYYHMRLNTKNDIVVLYGKNWIGKTNILEAVSFFSYGRGLRRAKFDSMIQLNSGKNFWNVIINIDEYDFSSGYIKTEHIGKRIFRMADKPGKTLDIFAEKNYILWMTYETDRLFLQPSVERRAFIDMFCYGIYSDHANNILMYEHLLKERQKILKEYYANQPTQQKNIFSWLDIVKGKISKIGTKIACNRIKITNIVGANQMKESDFPAFQNKMSGQLEELILQNYPENDWEQQYCFELQQRREKDFFTKMTTLGAHRSDWKVRHESNNMEAAICSAGEQKMLLSRVFLAFVAHKIQNDKRNLILLFDDIASHLDEKHRDLLFFHIKNIVKKNKGKINVWLSGIDKKFFAKLDECALFIDMKNNISDECLG